MRTPSIHFAIVLFVSGIALTAIQCTTGASETEETTTSASTSQSVPLEAGAPCAPVGAVVAQACGACGQQQAVCRLGDAGIATLSDLSACANERPRGCIPGTVEGTACGQGGTHARVCDNTCTWLTSACAVAPQL